MRIDNRVRAATGLDVQTPGTVARFAAHLLGVFPFCHEARVGRGAEITDDLTVACIATIGADKLRTRNAWRRQDRPVRIKVAARKQNDGKSGCSPRSP